METKHTCPYSVVCSHYGTEECKDDHMECRYFDMLANIDIDRTETYRDQSGIVHIIKLN